MSGEQKQKPQLYQGCLNVVAGIFVVVVLLLAVAAFISTKGCETVRESLEELNDDSDYGSTPDYGIAQKKPDLEKALKIASYRAYYSSDTGSLYIIGQVKNEWDMTLRFVKVQAQFYDTQDAFVGSDYVYTNPTDIRAGEVAPFEIIITEPRVYQNAARYELAVVGGRE